MKICVVIVTFNKLECLKKALISYEEQSKLPQCVIVVNNNSTDGTKDYKSSSKYWGCWRF